MRTRRLLGTTVQIISPTATGYLSIVENIYNHNEQIQHQQQQQQSVDDRRRA